MDLAELQRHWDAFGRDDPMWAILTCPEFAHRNWDPAEFFARGELEIAQILAYLDGLGIRPARGRALDFGCGIGRLTQALGREFREAVGVDIAPSMIELAQRYNRFGNPCSFALNARDDLAIFDSSSFDFIYSVIVLQHMEPRYSARYIAEFVRVLRPGGFAVFQIPSEAISGDAEEALEPAESISTPSARDASPAAGWDVTRSRSFLSFATRAIQRLGNLSPKLQRQKGEPRPPEPDGLRMEMHGIPRGEVERLVEAEGRIVDVRQDTWAGPGWESFTYTVTKDDSKDV